MRTYCLGLGAVMRTREFMKNRVIVALNYFHFSEGLQLSCRRDQTRQPILSPLAERTDSRLGV